MSSSTVTYISVYTDFKPWRFYRGSDEEPSDVAPPSPNYVLGPDHPPSPNYVPDPEHPPLPVYIHEPEYPEYLVPSEDETPMEDQPLPDNDSPTALSPSYVSSDDDDDDDDADDEDEEASENEDDDMEEEHLTPTDSSAILVVDPVPSVGDTEAFETDESAPTPPSPRSPQITPIPFPSEANVARLLALPTPPPCPLTPLSSPLPQIPLPPLLVSSPPLPLPSPIVDSPTYVEAPPGYRATGIRMRAASPPLLLPSTIHKDEIPKANLPPQKRLCLTAPSLRRDRVREMGYGITDTWDEIVEAIQKIAPTTLEEANQRVTKLATTVRQDTNEFYVRFEDAQDDQDFLRARDGSEDRSAAIEAHVRTLEAQVATLMAQNSSLQTQLTTVLGRIQTLEARDPEPQDELAEAGSSC
ncbi:hypothetical protein Tco_0650825 [Tanacetum coccineum]